MMPPNRTKVSTLTLLGPSPTTDMSVEWSVEYHVSDDAPATFLVHATDDPIAPVENSLLMFSALRKVHVPVEMHVFRSGGHGFNLGQPGYEGHQWPRLFATWDEAGQQWRIAGGTYRLMLARSADESGETTTLTLPAQVLPAGWHPEAARGP